MAVTIIKKLVAINKATSQDEAVIGIDPSTHTGIVVLKGATVAFNRTLHYPDTDGYNRLQLIADGTLKVVRDFNPKTILIERTVTSGSFVNQFQFYLAALIRDRLYSDKRLWYDVSPTTLKKWTTGDGRADKKKMMRCIAERWSFKTKDNNIADAFALAKLAQLVGSNQLPANFKGVNCGSEAIQA